jgi:hypothetical protein
MSNNQYQSAKTNESTMDIKHASACALGFFSFLNKQPQKVSREYMCQASKLKRKTHFEDCATQVNGSEAQI